MLDHLAALKSCLCACSPCLARLAHRHRRQTQQVRRVDPSSTSPRRVAKLKVCSDRVHARLAYCASNGGHSHAWSAGFAVACSKLVCDATRSCTFALSWESTLVLQRVYGSACNGPAWHDASAPQSVLLSTAEETGQDNGAVLKRKQVL